MLRRIASSLSVALLLSIPSLAADKPFVQVRWRGEQFRITYKTAVMTYDLQPGEGLMAGSDYSQLFMAQINKITTDYLDQRNGTVYLLLNIEGNSRGQEAAMGQCGAGEEKAKGFFVFKKRGS